MDETVTLVISLCTKRPHAAREWAEILHRNEINFNCYFCQYEPLCPLAEIKADVRALEQEIVEMLREVAE